MFNKLKFNNLVITNKKVIQKARAQTIAKLVHKLRKVKDALVKQPDNDKNKERLRKSVECVAQLKSFKSVDIMQRLLLQENKNPNAVITNGRATPDEVAIAMLALNKILQDVVSKFRETLELNSEADAAWRSQILETSKRRAKAERTEEKRRKRKELKEHKAQTRNRLEWLEQRKDATEASNELVTETEETVETVDIVKEENKDSEKSLAIPKKNVKKNDEKQEKIKIKTSNEDAAAETIAKPEKNLRKKNVNQQVIKNKTKIVIENAAADDVVSPEKYPKTNFKQRKTTAVKDKAFSKTEEVQMSKETLEPMSIPPLKKVKLTNNTADTEKERPTHVVDPFFITQTGEPFLSTAVVLPGDSNGESEDDEWPKTSDHRNSKSFGKRNEYKAEKTTKQFDSNSDRHPSWLAKQKQKPIISNFRGKKTTFGDDGEASEVPTMAIKASTEPAFVNENESNAGMHPSWIAKQKLKPKIAAFQGTKIKFDDD